MTDLCARVISYILQKKVSNLSRNWGGISMTRFSQMIKCDVRTLYLRLTTIRSVFPSLENCSAVFTQLTPAFRCQRSLQTIFEQLSQVLAVGDCVGEEVQLYIVHLWSVYRASCILRYALCVMLIWDLSRKSTVFSLQKRSVLDLKPYNYTLLLYGIHRYDVCDANSRLVFYFHFNDYTLILVSLWFTRWTWYDAGSA